MPEYDLSSRTYASTVADPNHFIIVGMGAHSPQWKQDPQTSNLSEGALIMDEETLGLTRLLLARLERISADSVWAHRASGIRGSLLRMLDRVEDQQPVSAVEMQRLMQWGFDILSRAARK